MPPLILELKYILLFVLKSIGSVWPYFLVSVALSVLIRALKLEGVIRRAFDKRAGLAVLLATLVGAFSPFCSCTVVPVIAGLLASGVPLAPVMSFWIASPTMDPEIFALSVGILGWPMALARLGGTLILSLAAGYLTLALTRTNWLQAVLPNAAADRGKPKKTGRTQAASGPGLVLQPSPVLATSAIPPSRPLSTSPIYEVAAAGTAACTECSAPAAPKVAPKVAPKAASPAAAPNWQQTLRQAVPSSTGRVFLQNLLRESWNIGRWLVLAFFLEALITQYVPQAKIAGLLGSDSAFAIPLAALVGVPLYLTNISALPIISGLLAQGMQPGAAIAFLIAGPVTTLPAMTAVWGTVHRRIFVLYLAIGLGGAMLLGVLLNGFLQ